jgi:Calcineurin-like phosphoesterase
MTGMFDLSLLPPALLEFVVLADSHLMLEGGAGSDEFPSRRLQTARGERAFRLVARLAAQRTGLFAIHLGDLVQEFPGGPDFDRAVAAAREQLTRSGLAPRLVAGNQDIGEKPDPTSPADWVSPATLDAYHRQFGPSWYSWDAAGLHFVVVNSQILNAELPEVDEQARWLAGDLAAHAGQRSFLFLHLAPFLVDPEEPDLGHYDNVAEPARRWLLDLCQRYRVDTVFAGHSHYLFFNRVGSTRLFVTPSVSFTRPGFGEIFSSAPPDERGRNDTAKLGFYLVRVLGDGARVHFVRTYGSVAPVEPNSPEQIILTRTSRDLPGSPLGIVSRQLLAPVGEVPSAWPSLVRQPMRNDFPLFACLELGARHLCLPLADLDDPVQRARIALARDEGVQLTATWVWSERHDVATRLARHRELVDNLEVQLPGAVLPPDACLRQIQRCRSEGQRPVTLATVIAREIVAGKQHPQIRIGYRASELADLERYLARKSVVIDRVLCRADPTRPPEESLRLTADSSELPHLQAIDWVVGLVGADETERLNRVAEAVFASAWLTKARVFLDPLVDLDRTYDVSQGLLDRQCNPRPTFHATRCLNSVLFSSPEPWRPLASPEVPGARILGARRAETIAWLLLPTLSAEPVTLDARRLEGYLPGVQGARRLDLATATSRPLDLDFDARTPLRIDVTAATLLVVGT